MRGGYPHYFRQLHDVNARPTKLITSEMVEIIVNTRHFRYVRVNSTCVLPGLGLNIDLDSLILVSLLSLKLWWIRDIDLI